MANLQIKGMDDRLYGEIKALAAQENRSVSQQVVVLIREYLNDRNRRKVRETVADRLLELAGSRADDRPADEIIGDLRSRRRNSRRLSEGL